MLEVSRLHHALGSVVERAPGMLRALGRAESSWLAEELAGVAVDRPIYVCGVARAGTTILLESLADHPDLASHRYRDFPFVHIPVWWNWFLDRAGGRPVVAVERAHKDGIFVTAQSPEAMEEVVWMSFFPRCHDPSVCNVIGGNHAAPAFERFYRDHLRKVVTMRGGSRYLAKGNYNVSRLGFLHRLFPDACFVIAVRDPLQHVASLLKQHRLFCEAEARNQKVLAYMRRSGHFEFGLDRRPVNFGDDAAARRIEAAWAQGDDIRGYAMTWATTYGFVAGLLEQDPALARRVLLVHYDDLCGDPASTLRRLHEHCGLHSTEDRIHEHAARIAAPRYYRADFSDLDREIIRSETKDVAGRIGRLVRRWNTGQLKIGDANRNAAGGRERSPSARIAYDCGC